VAPVTCLSAPLKANKKLILSKKLQAVSEAAPLKANQILILPKKSCRPSEQVLVAGHLNKC
jgi:hypothetical protein